MGTMGSFGVDSNVGAWLKSYLIDGPMGALPGGRRAPYFPKVCAVTSLFDPQSESVLEAVVLLDGGTDFKPRLPVKITEVGEISKYLRSIAPDATDIWSGAYVKFIQTPEVYAGSGDIVTAHKRGRAGLKVRWDKDSKEGILTAGHVVGKKSDVTVGKSPGKVAFSVDFYDSGTVPAPDVAVVELLEPPQCTFTSTGSARRGEMVDFLLGDKLRRTQILQLPDEGMFMPTRAGTAGQVYLASPSVTKGGDSGALAFNSRNEVIGHLLGGSGVEFDFIQAIDYQMEAIKLSDISL
jgi:hypothetical protein